MSDKEDLTKPLLEPYLNNDFDPKKYVAKRAHLSPKPGEEHDQEEDGLVRLRGRSMSALTDEHEFNPVRKMDPTEYYYLHVWGEDLADEDEDMHLNEDDTWPAEELLKLKLAEPNEK